MDKTALIVGASVMVGSVVLRDLLRQPEAVIVRSLVRRPSGLDEPRLEEIIHEDYLDYEDRKQVFSGIDIAFFCIGAYTGSVSDEELKSVTVDMAIAFGEMLNQHSPNARLCFLSGQGANRSEKSRTSFARYKGMAENHLLSLGLRGLHIFRPAYIYSVQKRQ